MGRKKKKDQNQKVAGGKKIQKKKKSLHLRKIFLRLFFFSFLNLFLFFFIYYPKEKRKGTHIANQLNWNKVEKHKNACVSWNLFLARNWDLKNCVVCVCVCNEWFFFFTWFCTVAWVKKKDGQLIKETNFYPKKSKIASMVFIIIIRMKKKSTEKFSRPSSSTRQQRICRNTFVPGKSGFYKLQRAVIQCSFCTWCGWHHKTHVTSLKIKKKKYSFKLKKKKKIKMDCDSFFLFIYLFLVTFTDLL